MSNMFDMGMFGMLHPDERKRILQGGSLFQKPSISDRQPGIETSNRGSLETAGGVKNIPTWAQNVDKKGYRGYGKIDQTDKIPIANQEIGRSNVNQVLQARGRDQKTMLQDPSKVGILKQDIAKTPVVNTAREDAIMKYGKGGNVPKDLNWWQKLSGMFNSKFDLEGAKASWTAKGGFEGLMANPAFTMGLAFMQSAAEGKTLGSGALDNVMKAGGISQHYKQIIEDRKQEPIQATAADIDEVKTMLDRVKLKEPNIWEKALGFVTGDNVTAKYDRASEAVAIAYQQEIESMQRNYKGKKPFVIDDAVKEKALLKVLKDKRVKQKDGWAIFGPFTSGTIQKESLLPKFNAQGGPVAKGEVSIVGEQGPEYFLPQESGKILSNDDSRIFSMLLSANPQLQNVSRTRAEKILRNRFPEYFE